MEWGATNVKWFLFYFLQFGVAHSFTSHSYRCYIVDKNVHGVVFFVEPIFKILLAKGGITNPI